MKGKSLHILILYCLQLGICTIWWDNGLFSEYGILNRREHKWWHQEIPDILIEEYKKANLKTTL